MAKPIIGIPVVRKEGDVLARYGATADYIEQIERAGGLPMLLPLTAGCTPATLRAWRNACDGFLLPGGGDLDPKLYGQSPIPGSAYAFSAALAAQKVKDSLARLSQETPSAGLWQQNALELVRLAHSGKVPMLGICLGAQVINVALGGDLYQDLPAQVPGCGCHSFPDASYADRACKAHPVAIRPKSLLGEAMHRKTGGPLSVNSFHHQAVCHVAPGLIVCAVAPDGVIEAVEDKKRNVLAVQWHPENLSAAGQTEAQALFRWLVHAAAVRQKAKKSAAKKA